MKRKIYALYKGDKYLGEGTAEELSKMLGIKKCTLYTFKSPSYINRTTRNGKNNRKILVDLEEYTKQPTYALYHYNELIATGTLKDFAKLTNHALQTMICYNSRAYKEAHPYARYRIEVIE